MIGLLGELLGVCMYFRGSYWDSYGSSLGSNLGAVTSRVAP